MKSIRVLTVISITLILISFLSAAEAKSRFEKLDEKATFIEGENLITGAPYTYVELSPQPITLEQRALGMSTVKVDRNGTQYQAKISVEDYRVFTHAVEKLKSSGFSSALFSSPGASPTVPPQTSGKLNARIIVGSDDRVQVTDTTASPYKYSGRIDVGCTGVLVGPKHVLTAGHCVSRGDGTWYYNLNFTVAQNGSSKPWGTEVWVSSLTTNAWLNGGDRNYDYGMIILKNSPHGGWAGYGVYSGGTHSISGYPSDKPAGTMWTHSGPTEPNPYHIGYTIDTFGGQSGSGILDASGEVRGVHTLGNSHGNLGTRLTTSAFSVVKNWVDDHK